MLRPFLIAFVLHISFSCLAQQADDIYFIDTHNDVLSKQVKSGVDISVSQPGLDFDLPKATKGNLRAQMFSIWCDEVLGKEQAFKHATKEIDSLQSFIKRNQEHVAFVTNSKELKKALRHKKFAALIGVEGGHMIEERMDYLDSFINRGMKYLTLTWNNSTTWATSARDETFKKDSLSRLGLNEMGKQIVARLNEAKVMIDVSHAGEKTVEDVLAITTKPIIASHSCAYAISPHPRNLKDYQLKAIAANGGVVFVNFYSEFLDSTYLGKKNLFLATHKATLDSLTTQLGDPFFATIQLYKLFPAEAEAVKPPLQALIHNIDYMVKLIGIDHVGIGADFDGAESFPQQMNDVSNYPLLIDELRKLGYSTEQIKKICHGNFLRVFAAIEK
ncbi:MAG: dipeptidase [Ferruginibacter sp.]|nr:dipeptidase [Ferruginibacter sp.]